MCVGVQYHVLALKVQKYNFGPPYFSSKWTKIAAANNLRVDQKRQFDMWSEPKEQIRTEKTQFFLESSDHVSKGNIGPISNSWKLQFWSISKRNWVDQNCIFELFWTKILSLAWPWQWLWQIPVIEPLFSGSLWWFRNFWLGGQNYPSGQLFGSWSSETINNWPEG